MSHPYGWDDPDRRDGALDRLAAVVGYDRPRRVEPTPAELDVLQAFSYGMTLPMVASVLGRSEGTVHRQCQTARHRLAAKNMAHAVALAIRAGYIA